MKNILDVCCGSKMMWFNKQNDDVVFGDIRLDTYEIQCKKEVSVISITPDIQFDFRQLPFENESFRMVVFDPPHLMRISDNSILYAKYGKLGFGWKEDLREGFQECFRVLKPFGTLIFKWSDIQIPLSEILKLSPVAPLFGNRNSQKSHTYWVVFLKPGHV